MRAPATASRRTAPSHAALLLLGALVLGCGDDETEDASTSSTSGGAGGAGSSYGDGVAAVSIFGFGAASASIVDSRIERSGRDCRAISSMLAPPEPLD